MCPEGFANTTTVVVTVLHTRNAVTEGAHFSRRAHFSRPSPKYTLCTLSFYDSSTYYWFSVSTTTHCCDVCLDTDYLETSSPG